MCLYYVRPNPQINPTADQALLPLFSFSMDTTKESALAVIFEEDETLDYGNEDVEMIDADEISGCDGEGEAAEDGPGSEQTNENQSVGKKKKKNNKKRRRKNGGSAPNITDINRFVIDTCRRLKEQKSYLVWEAIRCLGISVVSHLVSEVDTIQKCGGQKTVDGRRFRTGGGILWNILKTQEPKAYKEIMTKGREFEQQLLQPKKKQKANINEQEVSQNTQALCEAGNKLGNSESTEMQLNPEPIHANEERKSVHSRIRVPVSYDDLYEEGEIHE